MIIHHGTSGCDLSEAREAAPSHTHGRCWTPSKMTPKDDPFTTASHRCGRCRHSFAHGRVA